MTLTITIWMKDEDLGTCQFSVSPCLLQLSQTTTTITGLELFF